jgi:hypothetical protein
MEFHQTARGAEFFDVLVPRLVKAIERVGKTLDRVPGARRAVAIESASRGVLRHLGLLTTCGPRELVAAAAQLRAALNATDEGDDRALAGEAADALERLARYAPGHTFPAALVKRLRDASGTLKVD